MAGVPANLMKCNALRSGFWSPPLPLPWNWMSMWSHATMLVKISHHLSIEPCWDASIAARLPSWLPQPGSYHPSNMEDNQRLVEKNEPTGVYQQLTWANCCHYGQLFITIMTCHNLVIIIIIISTIAGKSYHMSDHHYPLFTMISDPSWTITSG